MIHDSISRSRPRQHFCVSGRHAAALTLAAPLFAGSGSACRPHLSLSYPILNRSPRSPAARIRDGPAAIWPLLVDEIPSADLKKPNSIH